MCHQKRKSKFEVFKDCLVATQLENKVNHLEKITLLWIVLKKIIKDFYKNNTLILRTQQIFKSEKYNILMKKLVRFI